MVLFITIGINAFAQSKDNGKTRTRFNVELHCQSCIMKIEKNIPYEKGVTDLKCDLQEQWVEVEYKNDKTNDTKLIEAFQKLGKEATVANDVKAKEATPDK